MSDLLRGSRDKRLCPGDEQSVSPVELQTLGMVLEGIHGSDLSVKTLRQSGGKAGLMRSYIEEVQQYVKRKCLATNEQSIAVLRSLTSEANTRLAPTANDVAKRLGLRDDLVPKILDAYVEAFVVNRLPGDGGGPARPAEARYELMHDYVARIIKDAPSPALQRLRDAEARLQFWKEQTAVDHRSLADIGAKRKFKSILAIILDPVPAFEVIRLWRYASDLPSKAILRRSLLGATARLGALMTMVVLGFFGWWRWTTSDAYEIGTVLNEAPVGEVAQLAEVGQVTHSYYTDAISAWIAALCISRNPSRAYAVAEILPTPALRNEAYDQIARSQASIGEVSDALQASNKVVFNYPMGMSALATRVGIADELRAAGLKQEAISVADKTFRAAKADSTIGYHVMPAIAKLFASLGHTAEATSSANLIDDLNHRAETVAEMAGILAKHGYLGDARQFSIQAEKLASLLPNVPSRLDHLITMATSLKDAGSADTARSVTALAEAALNGSFDRTPRTSDIVRVSMLWSELGDYQRAGHLAKRAEIALSANRPDSYDFSGVASALANAGRFEDALQIVCAVPERERFLPLRYIATAYALRGRLPEAINAAKLAMLPVGSKERDAYEVAELIGWVLVSLSQEGKTETICTLLKLSISPSFDVESGKKIATGLLSSDHLPEALKLVRSARLAEAERIDLLLFVARMAVKSGHGDVVRNTIDECAERAKSLATDSHRSCELAQVYSALHQYELARRACEHCHVDDKLNAYAAILSDYARRTYSSPRYPSTGSARERAGSSH